MPVTQPGGDGPVEGVPDLTQVPDDALYTARVPMALAYAAVKHSAQTRKDDLELPYITHPMAVATLIWHYGLPHPEYAAQMEDLVIAGLLHDVAEDSGGSQALTELEAMFGPRVAGIVAAASDSLVADRHAKAPWRERKQRHIARIRDLAQPDDGDPDRGACLVIACDKFHNLSQTAAAVSASGDGYLTRFNGGVDGTRWYYRAMFEALEPALPRQLAADTEVRLATLGA